VPIALHVVHSLDFGGVESHMKIINAHQEKSVYEHIFCAISAGGNAQKSIEQAGGRVEVFGLRDSIPSLWTIIKLVQYFRRVQPDVIHCHGAEANFHGILAAYLAGVKVRVAEEIGIPEHSWIATVIFRGVYAISTRCLAVAQSVAMEMVRLGEIKLGRVEILNNPAPLPPMRENPPCSDQITIGYVGRLEPVKNPVSIVDTVYLLRQRGVDASAIIVGEGSLKSSLENRILSFDLFEHVKLLGFQELPFEAIKDCSFFVQPSISEGLSLALVEAMSLGIPVVVSANGGGSEVVQDRVTGFLLQIPQAAQIATSIEDWMVLSASERLAMVDNARSSVIERFSASRYFEGVDRLYGEAG
jgi:glycosyltransferase involved in cell wall biosynthesis